MHVPHSLAFASLPAASGRTGHSIRVAATPTQNYWVVSNGNQWVAQGYVHIGTFANLPAVGSTPLWAQAVITDMGNMVMTSNGTNWVPQNGRGVFYSPTQPTMTDSTGTTDTVVLSKQIPAACLIVDSYIYLDWSLTKSSSQAINGNIRLGTAGTIADASIAAFTLSTTNVSFGRMERYLIESATTIRRMGAGNTSDDDNYDGGSNNQPGSVTIPNISGALYLTCTLAWAVAATPGDNTKVRQFVAELVTRT